MPNRESVEGATSIWLCAKGWEEEFLLDIRLYGLDKNGGGVGGSGGGGLTDPPGEDMEVLENLESAMGREDPNAVELLLKTYSD